MSCIASLYLCKRLYKTNRRYPPSWMEQSHTLLISENVSCSRWASQGSLVANLVCPRNISSQGAMALLVMQWLFFWDLPDLQQPPCRGVDGHQKQQDWECFLCWLGSIPPPFYHDEVLWARVEGHHKTFSSLKIWLQKCKHVNIVKFYASIPVHAPFKCT